MIDKATRGKWRELATYSEGNIADVLAEALDAIEELETEIMHLKDTISQMADPG